MATFVKRNGKCRVQIRRAGVSLSKTFALKKDAELWARTKELELERGVQGVFPLEAPNTVRRDTPEQTDTPLLKDLVERYRDKVTPKKEGRVQETYWLNAFLRQPMCSKSLAELKISDWAEYRDLRLQKVQPITLFRQLAVLHNMFEIARDEWELPLQENPLDRLNFKATRTERTRRLEFGELSRISVYGDDKRRNPLFKPFILFAIETGMRRSEILRMKWEHLNRHKSTLIIPKTKNGHSREIPVTTKGWETLDGLPTGDSDYVFPVTADAVKCAWDRMRKALKLSDLRLHDMRREAISSYFERDLDIPEVATISGHRDWRMLKVYTRPRPENIARKLNSRTAVS